MQKNKAVEKIVRPIVEGQLRGFLKEHPGVLQGVDWYKPRKDKTETFVNSVAKRIVRDLVCDHNVIRLEAIFVEHERAKVENARSGRTTGAGRPWLASRLVRAAFFWRPFNV